MRTILRTTWILLLTCIAAGCGQDAGTSDGPEVVSDSDTGVSPDGAQTDGADVVCDTDCLADRILAVYLGLEPGCRCGSESSSGVLEQDQIDVCAEFQEEQTVTFVSPRACVAEYYSEPEAAAALDSYLTCREQRIQTRGPCIMALQAGDSCEQCPEFFEDGVDPCDGPDTGEEYFELCTAEMAGIGQP